MIVQNLKEGKDREVGEDLNSGVVVVVMIVIEVCPILSKIEGVSAE